MREMLADRKLDLEKESDEHKKREIVKDIQILEKWVSDCELKQVSVSSREKSEEKQQKARKADPAEKAKMSEKKQNDNWGFADKDTEGAVAGNVQKQTLVKKEGAPAQTSARPAVAKLAVAMPTPAQRPAAATVNAGVPVVDKATVLLPVGSKEPPCNLPIWCVMPNPRDIVTPLEIVRKTKGSSAPPKRLVLGRRSWALFGRRLPPNTPGAVAEPDIGLAAERSSRSHAVVLQNWLGQLFLQDLATTNGTFLNGVRLKPNETAEWKIGTKVFFADDSLETFEVHPAK